MTDPFEETDLSHAESMFDEAATLMREGDLDRAKDLFKQVLEADPRLPEPYLELAIVAREDGDLDLAVAEARMGLELLEKGGQWLESLSEHVVLAHARNLLGELLIEAAQQGDTPLDPERFAPLWNEAVALFESARETDPDNADARANAGRYEPYTFEPSTHDE
jgi:tetratricopeptide (TPR) repeat protein